MSLVTSRPQKLEAPKSTTHHFGILKEITPTNIPVQYSFKELKNYELPVIGTYVHSHILPGFRYRVRLSDTNDYLFGGKALKLESIGQGYGKRITFESKDILENNNFFWSDSHEAGFAFSPEILSGGDVFEVTDNLGNGVGTFSVDWVNPQQQITRVTLEKHNVVNIHAKVNLCGSMRLLSHYEKNIPLTGEAIIKVNRFSCTLEFLKVENGVLDVLLFIKHLK